LPLTNEDEMKNLKLKARVIENTEIKVSFVKANARKSLIRLIHGKSTTDAEKAVISGD
jgi:hypothetical protein